ncbi:DUF2125 domain-containing protein [Sulfitobacter sp. HNIBRBA2951]|uniref:DUF2125 domain-containing protein n=1 Tax=Sulfitobacter aquimarinus TaxID=3158557 RepID=UPI0032DE7C39
MKRWLVKILLVCALLWGGWWWIATGAMQKGLDAFWQGQRDSGLDVTVAQAARSGFPLRIGTTLRDITLSDPAAQTALKIPHISIASPVYWPGDVAVTLPAEPITFTAAQGPLTLMSDGMQADLNLHPGTALALEAMRGKARAVTLDAVEGRVLSVEEIATDVIQTTAPETYAISLVATGVAPGSLIRQGLQVPDAWADSFAPILADIVVTFDRPWDRSALRNSRPQPRVITINQLTAEWDQLGFEISGNLNVDNNGVPTGDVRVQVRNWQRIFNMITDSTDVPAQWTSTIESVLGAMSDAQGTLDLPVTLQNGQMRVGFFPLGPAPRIVIR